MHGQHMCLDITFYHHTCQDNNVSKYKIATNKYMTTLIMSHYILYYRLYMSHIHVPRLIWVLS